MKTPTVSSPTRPPKAHLFFITEDVAMESHAYAELFVAKYWVNALIKNHEYKWITDDIIEIQGKRRTFRIKGPNLEDVMEYTFSKAEKDYRPEWCFQAQINKLMEWDRDINTTYVPAEPSTQPEPKPEPTRPRRAQKRKASDNGNITVAQMADELDISAGKARTALRKAKEPKPDQGWNYETDSAEANRIFDIIKQSIV